MTLLLHAAGSRMEVVLADLDSTLADTRQRRNMCPSVNPIRTWASYAMTCGQDTPIAGTVRAVRMLRAAGYGLHLVTNRPECARALTVGWLAQMQITFDALHMRPDEQPHDTDIKIPYIRELRRRGYDPVLFVEDWPATAAAIEAEGVPVLCVNPRYADTPAAT